MKRPRQTASLYSVLAEPAPPGADARETINTREKETIDRDVEMFVLEDSTNA